MSRNKDIRLLHNLTGDPYSVCRRRMKRNHWNLTYAIAEGTPYAALLDAIQATTDALKDAFVTLGDAVNTFSETFRNSLKQCLEGNEVDQVILDDFGGDDNGII